MEQCIKQYAVYCLVVFGMACTSDDKFKASDAKVAQSETKGDYIVDPKDYEITQSKDVISELTKFKNDDTISTVSIDMSDPTAKDDIKRLGLGKIIDKIGPADKYDFFYKKGTASTLALAGPPSFLKKGTGTGGGAGVNRDPEPDQRGSTEGGGGKHRL